MDRPWTRTVHSASEGYCARSRATTMPPDIPPGLGELLREPPFDFLMVFSGRFVALRSRFRRSFSHFLPVSIAHLLGEAGVRGIRCCRDNHVSISPSGRQIFGAGTSYDFCRDRASSA